MLQFISFLLFGCVLVFCQHCTHRKTDGAMGRNFKPLYPALSKDIINYVNDITNTSWIADPESEIFHSANDIKRRLGVIEDPNKFKLPKLCKMLTEEQKENIPSEFDARSKFENCESLKKVDDNGNCASSWAFAAVESINDRYCVFGNKTPALSVQDVLTCCGSLCGAGCGGGIPSAAWDFWVYNGIVSGEGGCKPYTFKKRMDKSDSEKTCDDVKTPKCSASCEKNLDYAEDKSFGERAYSLSNLFVDIADEIMKYGSVQAELDVYADFPSYKSGIYKHVAGHKLGNHAVRIIGWGEEEGEKYWLCANNWNTKWGIEGTFKILRGVNECNIESNVNSGIPKVEPQ